MTAFTHIRKLLPQLGVVVTKVLSSVGVVSPAQAVVNFYSNRSDFLNATAAYDDRQFIDFENLNYNYNYWTYYSGNSITQQGVQFIGGNKYVLGDGYAYSHYGLGSGDALLNYYGSPLNIILPTGTRAFSADIAFSNEL